MAISEDGFKLFSSLDCISMDERQQQLGWWKNYCQSIITWALFFQNMLMPTTQKELIFSRFTVENEPHGNGENWESMHYSPQEMTDFVQNFLGPKLEADGKGQLKILGYDQNREGIREWVDVMYKDEASSKYYDGTAIHWYESTYDYFSEELQYAHIKAPEKYLIQTEACVDAEVPVWKDDKWYWKKEATDWDIWREKIYLHPKYAPANRYAREILSMPKQLGRWLGRLEYGFR